MNEYIKLEVWVPAFLINGEDEEQRTENAIDIVRAEFRHNTALAGAIVSER
jgi:hypothetical protein